MDLVVLASRNQFIANLLWFLVSGMCVYSTLAQSLSADVVFTTSQAAFSSLSTTTLVEDFEDFAPKDRSVPAFARNGISYQTQSDPLYVASPGYTNFGVPLTESTVLTANGEEDFTMTFEADVVAVGFDTYTNNFGPVTIEVYGDGGLLDSFSLNQDSTEVGFLGITSSERITSIFWSSVNGRTVNTGVDNIRLGFAAVPEPSSLAYTTIILGLLCTRRARPDFLK